RQALRRLGVFRLVCPQEQVERLVGLGPPWGQVNRVQHLLGFGLDTLGQLVQHVGRLVHPAALLAHLRPELPYGLPEPQRPVADRQLRLDRQPACLHVQEQFLPRLLALALTVLNGDQFLLAVGRGPQQDQDALPAAFQADVEVHAVGPDVGILLASQRAFAPVLVLLFPDALESGDGGRRQPLGLWAEQGRQRLTEVAGADPLEVEPGDQLLDALGLAQVRRQDRRGKLLSFAGRPAVVDSGLLDRDRPEARGDGAVGQVAVADDPATAARIPAVLVAFEPVSDFGVDSLSEEFLGTLAEDVGEGVLGLGQWHDPDISRRKVHGGVLLCRVGTFGEPHYTKSTPPCFIPLSTTFDHTPSIQHRQESFPTAILPPAPHPDSPGKWKNRGIAEEGGAGQAARRP